MSITLVKLETFYEEHEKATLKTFKNNYYNPIERLVRDCLELSETDDVVPCLKDHADVIGKVKETYSNLNTIKFYLQAIVWLVTNHPNLSRKIGKRATEAYVKAWEVSKSEQMLEQASTPKPTYPKYETIQKTIDEHYGKRSLESMFVMLYGETSKRLDYGEIQVVASKNLIPDTGNYLVIQGGNMVFREYNKTSERYGETKIKLSSGLMTKVRKHLKDNPRDLLFTFTNQSVWISKMLKEAGFQDGNMTWLRHSVASQPMTAEQRVEVAKRSGHSLQTSINTYRGEIQQPEDFLPEN